MDGGCGARIRLDLRVSKSVIYFLGALAGVAGYLGTVAGVEAARGVSQPACSSRVLAAALLGIRSHFD